MLELGAAVTAEEVAAAAVAVGHGRAGCGGNVANEATAVGTTE